MYSGGRGRNFAPGSAKRYDRRSRVAAAKQQSCRPTILLIKRRKLTQAKAAEYFGVPQPKISKIVGGKVGSFSIEYLVKMVAKAGKAPRISFAKRQVA